MRITKAMVSCIRVLADANTELTGHEVIEAAGGSSSMYQLLRRLQGLGWVDIRVKPQASDRRLSFYRLTEQGRSQASRFTQLSWK